jgi:hypothetical protein
MNMKRKLLIICSALLCFCLVACGKAEYTDTQGCKALCHTAIQRLDDGLEYAEFGTAHLRAYFDEEQYDDYCIMYSTDTNNINEIGVFHVSDKKAARQLEAECLEYIENMREGERAFIASYAPHELPKLDGALVSRYGNYVVYTILPQDKTAPTLQNIEGLLKKQ